MTPVTDSSASATRVRTAPAAPLAFVVLSTQRSGSTRAIETMNSHPHVVAYSEPFLEGAHGRPQWGGAKDVVFRHAFSGDSGDTASREDRLRHHHCHMLDRPGAEAAGFKLTYGQAGAYPELLPLLAERGGRALHLVRRNGLDVLLSRETAWARGQYHARDGNVRQSGADQ